jgi:hypothetical protein
MELLKVFVGDGAATAATSVATMTPGDLLILDAASYTPVTSANIGTTRDIVIASCINKNGVNTPVFSTPIKKANIKHVNATQGLQTRQKVVNVGFGFSTTTLSDFNNKTFSLGVQLKEDLRMGTYNKNTEVIVSHTCPSTAYASVTKLLEDMSSTLAKGFAANPLTSAGSPYNLVKVERTTSITKTSLAIATETFTFTKGAREVSIATDVAASFTLGTILSVGQGTGTYDAVYIVEKAGVYDSVSGRTYFSLDTAYQGESSTNLLATGTTVGTTVGTLSALTVAGLDFKFTGVTLPRSNRYDQNRVTDYIVIYPKGFDAAGDITLSVGTELRQGVGTYAQVRDLEEKAYTNSTPLINYREFPFEDFALNATSGTGYSLLTINYLAGWGYNMMQSSQPEFLQTVVVAAPFIADGDFDVTSSNNGFIEAFNTWYGSANSGVTSMQFTANPA